MTNLLLIFANEFEKLSLQVSTFVNESWKRNFLGIDLRQIDQSSWNLGKLVPQRFVFDKIDIFTVMHAFFMSNAFFQLSLSVS